jgi:hypothetical protein
MYVQQNTDFDLGDPETMLGNPWASSPWGTTNVNLPYNPISLDSGNSTSNGNDVDSSSNGYVNGNGNGRGKNKKLIISLVVLAVIVVGAVFIWRSVAKKKAKKSK